MLWALMFLKTYAKESVLSGMAGSVDEKTFRKWVWLFVCAIASLESNVVSTTATRTRTALYFYPTFSASLILIFSLKIVWEKRLERDSGNDCLVSVDGTDFRIQQPSVFSKIWYSHKFKGPGLRYEVAVSILTGDIVWLHGPLNVVLGPISKNFEAL